MKIKNNYIVSVLVCAVLFLASCAEDEMADGTHSQKQDLCTVSVDLGMPQGKPAYGDGTDSRAQMADTIATGYRLSFDTAETGKPDASRAGSNNWIDGDRLLLHIVASNADQTTQTTEGMLTLTYSDSKWSLDAVNSYTKYGASFVDYNSAQPKLLITDDDTDIDLANLKMHVDEKIGVSANVTATLFYAPHMKWRLTEGSVTLVVDETASTYEKWEWTNTNSSWTTPYARLRVNTGAEGDVVTLTSSAFDSAWEDEPTEGIYTATTDAEGDAYFYGRTNGDAALTANFLVELTQMRVPVPTAAPASEGRSITLEDESTLLIDLDDPITLLEASDVVPVTLTATKAYRIEANVKREASAVANLSVIDGGGNTEGTADDVTTVKAQIETAVAMGITEFTVINQLASYSKVNEIYAGSVVGEAIRLFGSNNIDTKITLTLADATVVPELAFIVCEALQSVTAPAATSIGEYAFAFCSGLTSVSLPEATNIGEQAFAESGLIGGLSLPAATTIGISAFLNCTALTSVSLPEATSIGKSAFEYCTALMSVSLPAAETIGYGAFSGCIDITKVVADKATMIEKSAFDGCTSLMSVSLPEATSIGSFAFGNCTDLTTVTLPKVEKILTFAFQKCTSLASVVANSATEIWPSVFSECTGLTSVTFGAVIETIEQNYSGDSPFSDFSTENCDLTLHAAQLNHDTYPVSVSNDGKLMWAGKQWKSITLLDGPNGTAGTKYTIVDGVPTVEVDGTCGITGNNPIGEETHVSAMEQKIKVVAVAATANAPAKVIVKNGLASFGGLPKTVVGNAINRGYVHLVLDDAITSIPKEAFENNGVLVSVTTSATTIGESAFYGCSSLTSVSLRATSATTIGEIAFMACSHLATVDLSANTAIGKSAFEDCFDLTSMDWTKVTSIGVEAFLSCSSLTGELSLPNVTSIGDDSFQGCTFTKVTFGKVVTGYESTFEFANVSNCDLELAAGQTGVTASGGQLMWAGAEWKSITVGGVKYAAKGNELYAVIDGTDSYLNLSTYVQKGNLKFYVVNGLSGITKAFTIDGTGASEGSISLVLDEGITDIPTFAFQDCNALGSVVANGVTSIGYGAFSGNLAIEELTFKKVISYNDNDSYKYAFGQQPQDGYYWTFNCTLTLNESQSELYEYDNIPSVIWGSCFWKSITIGGQAFPGDPI